jgi:hypothetical protein
MIQAVQQTRYKTVVIPYVKIDDAYEYVMFRDSNYKEYTFACGGKKQRETYDECGNRELYEESNGIFNGLLTPCDVPITTIISKSRSRNERLKDIQEGVIVTMNYIVYCIEVIDKDYPHMFHASKLRNSETDDCVVVSKREMIDNMRVWPFMLDNIVPLL